MPACKSFELRLVALDRAGNRMVATERYFHPVLANENDALLPASEADEVEKVTDRPSELEIANTEWTTIELGSRSRWQVADQDPRTTTEHNAEHNAEHIANQIGISWRWSERNP